MLLYGNIASRTLTLLLCCLSAIALSAERPKIGLVLGGGGARGAAHIGVLEELERLRIPVDCVAGTSMGALVAGAWASGLDAATLRSELGKADWNDLFQDNPGYNDINYRSKRLAKRFLPGSEAGITPNGLVTPPGVVAGQKIKLFFNQLVRSDAGDRMIEQLAIPVSIIATDIGTGARVVFREGSLTLAMRASMSVPGLVAPLDYDGRKLVDGGLVDNLPIQEVRNLCGAEVVIAVNVSTPLLHASEINGFLSISTQMVSILTEQNVTQSLAGLTADDIYIKPDLASITAAQFERSAEAADRGRLAAQGASALAGLSVSPDAYAAWRARWAAGEQPLPQVDAIEIAGLKAVNPVAIERYLEQKTGERLNVAQLNRNLLRAYGDGYYERVDYTLTHENDKNLLRITPVEKAWGPDYVRLGINLNSTLTGRSTFSLRGVYQKTWLNPLGGEFLATAELGSNTGVGTELYQPLDPQQRYFLDAAASVRRENFALFIDDLRISDYRNSIGRLDLTAGMNIGMTGQLRLGLRNERQTATIEAGLPLVPDDPLHVQGWLASWETDQKNQLHISSTGWSGKGSWFESTAGHYNRLNLNLEGSYQLQNWVLGVRGSYVGSTYGQIPMQEMGRLGGFLNLSGFANDQLIGDRMAYGHLRVERILGRMPLGLSGDMRLGLALEAAKVADPLTEPRRTGLLNSTVIYMRGETPFGPAYIGVGQSSSGPVNAYLFIGTP